MPNPDQSWKARGATVILDEKRSFGENRGRASVRIADHFTYGNQRRRRGVSSELKLRFSRPVTSLRPGCGDDHQEVHHEQRASSSKTHPAGFGRKDNGISVSAFTDGTV
jgi:hypothetical protein